MENIETLLAAAAVAQTQGFGDDGPVVVSISPDRGLEGSEFSPAIRDGFEDARPFTVVDTPPPDPTPVFPAAERVVGTGEKRKRGRPPKGQQIAAKTPPPKRNKLVEDEDEDVCFICFDGGSLVLCDRNDAQRLITLLVLSEMKIFLDQKLNGTADGTYVVYVRRPHIICVTLAPIHCARDASKMQIMRVLEETKGFARPA
ncbi:hypothetical protein CASFOL_027131 [Castilleja foliolosa]|uniref:Uncharacterized protein n=1 Tax=Castilleja foliolosa TaxID=1961234 RepID=A0ABD3CGP4_9LAMI